MNLSLSATAVTDLQSLYRRLNAQFFGSALPPCDIVWSARLTRTGGHIQVQKRVITLSIPLLQAAFQNGGHTVCGVWCDHAHRALEEILKHEMIHLWLFEQGVPHGHTPLFRAKAKAIGQPKTRHEIAAVSTRKKLVYSCPHCEMRVWRQRKFRDKVACAACCKKNAGGKFDIRFVLEPQKPAA